MKEEKLKCRYCGKMLTPYVPKGGDGSLTEFRRHNNRLGVRCDGSWTVAWEMGRQFLK